MFHVPQGQPSNKEKRSTMNGASQLRGRRAERALRGSHYLGLKRVVCEIEGDTLVLRGRVQSYFLKQVAQTIVGEFAPSGDLDNQIEVADATVRRA